MVACSRFKESFASRIFIHDFPLIGLVFGALGLNRQKSRGDGASAGGE